MKKKLLFIEDQILRYDQSAGARASYMYLRLLLDMGVSVTFIGADFKKIEPYENHLNSLGIKVLSGNFLHYAWKLWFFLFGRKFDYVFFNRPYPTKRFIDFIKKFSNAKTLYQCHDLHYLRLKRQYEIDGDPKTLELSKNVEDLEIEVIKKSDIFFTFSHFEKDTIKKRLPEKRIEVIPLFFYDKLHPPVSDFAQRRGILYVGGFKHKPNIDAVLWFAGEIFPQIEKSCPDIEFYIVGSSPPAEITKLANSRIKVLGYVTDERLVDLYSKVRLVVVPLRFGSGVKGKTVEAIHHSLPLVSTSIGIEGIGLEDIVPPTDDPAAFADRVVALYGDEAALRECSSRLHRYARENLSSESARAKMKNILDSLASNSSK